ncbi:hypothetical protein LOK49_LG03G02888 [Camellia lanceoleosa]|uniref:Uncharacterized protein n=1 Tax=Camellia lanceoleosa TaxID=1840588 RepID=A0ACC0I8F7_9ERIC|nr:hypothetical protein LOK49_LG03G02888 [Camellia lanceoleosa]
MCISLHQLWKLSHQRLLTLTSMLWRMQICKGSTCLSATLDSVKYMFISIWSYAITTSTHIQSSKTKEHVRYEIIKTNCVEVWEVVILVGYLVFGYFSRLKFLYLRR